MVCTGNVCRSPLAELVLKQALTEGGVEALVSSAGLLADGMPAATETIDLLRERGLDATEHLSRHITPELVAASNLVIGMTREHVREVALTRPDALARSFTLKELVRRAREIGPRPADESVEHWLYRAQEGRPPTAHLGGSAIDDIDDPMGRRFGVHKKTAAEISALLDEFVALAWPVDHTANSL